jgi:hypothetical protein
MQLVQDDLFVGYAVFKDVVAETLKLFLTVWDHFEFGARPLQSRGNDLELEFLKITGCE